MRGTVFFENATHAHRPWIAWYLARGYRVAIFNFSYQLKRTAWLRNLLFQGRVERIYIHINSRADGWAIDAAEWLYPRLRAHPLIRRIQAIYGVEESEPVFKHALVEDLSRYFFCRLFLERRIESAGPGEILFVPETYRFWDKRLGPWCRQRGLSDVQGLRLPRAAGLWSEAAGRWGSALQAFLRYSAQGALLAVAGLLRLLPGRGRIRSERCTYLYSVDSSFQTKFGAGRRFDFLLDGQRITRENTLFLVAPSVEGPWLDQARKAGYRILLRSEYGGIPGLLRHPPRDIPWARGARAIAAGLLRIGAPGWVHAAAATGLGVLLREEGLLESIQFSHYIYTGQYRLAPRWRNILIRRAGAESWWFVCSNGGGHLYRQYGPFGGNGDFGGRHRFWAYENVDHFVSPSASLIGYHRLHHQRIRRYHDVGNIWSEQILEAEAGIDRERIRAEWFGHAAPGAERKVIAWFDTTFVEAPNSPSTITEAVQWYRDILRLADEDGRLAMVIKPSKDEGYFVGEGPERQWAIPREGRRLMELWQEARRHPRVRLLGNSADPTILLAASDLAATFHVSSVSAEALGARKRAIWYEPGQRWRDTAMGREPLLCAHGYEELRALVRKLLFEMGEEAYQAFLDEKVRGLVETLLDGKGLTRFRSLLTGVPSADRDPQSLRAVGSCSAPSMGIGHWVRVR